MRNLKRMAPIFLALLFSHAALASSPASFTYEGVLTDSGGTPVDLNGQTITFSIVDVSNCVIYQESSTSAGDSNGLISHAVGTGSVSYGAFGAALFDSAQTGSGGCSVTNTATRYLKVSVASPAISATVNLTSVPYALESTAVGGYSASSLLRTDNTVASVAAFNNTEYTKLLDLIAGSSALYIQQSSPTFSSQPQYSGVPSSGNDLTNKTYVDGVVSGVLPNILTPGTFTKVVTDSKGRVTSGTSLVEADVPHLSTAGKVDGGAINAGTIGGSAAINTSGNVTTSGSVTGASVSGTNVSTNNLFIYNAANTKYIKFTSNPGSNLSFLLPTSYGTSGQVLSTDGTGNLSWASSAGGSVNNVTATAPLSSSGGTSPDISISQSSSSTNGYLSSTDWNTFNSKLGTSASFSGDVSGAYNATSVNKIKGTALSINSLTTGNFLKYNGSAWVNSNLSAGDIPNLDTSVITSGTLPISKGGTGSAAALTNNKVMVSSGGAIVEGNGFGSAKAANSFVVRDASGNFAAGAATLDSLILKGGTSGTLTMTAPASFTSYSLNWPAADGSAGQFLKTDGAGNLSWATSAAPGDATYAAKGIVQFNTDAATSGISLSSGIAKVNYGTGANQIVQLDGSSKLPAVDGSALTNLNANNISSGTLPISRGGTGASTKTAAFDALSPNTTKGDLIVSDGTNNIRLPRGSDGQVLTADSAQTEGVKWSNVSAGTVTNVTAGTGLMGGAITSTGTLAVNVGTGANQIVQLTAASKLPAVDGSLLTNLDAGQIATGTLPVSKGGTGTSSFAANNLVGTNGTGTALQAVTCSQNQVLSFDASGNYGCYNLSSIAGGTYFANGGNSFGANATLGTNDPFSLRFMTNNFVAMTIDASGKVGIGTTSPTAPLDVKGEIRMSGATSGYAGLKSPAVGPNVTWTLPTADGSAGQFLKTDGSGNLSWATASSSGITSLNGLSASAQTFAIGTTGIAPFFSSTTATHTLNIPMASASGVTAGLLSKTDYDAFNNKLGTGQSFFGDVSGAYNATSVDKIKGTSLSFTTLGTGNFLKYNGSAWVNSNLSAGDIPNLDASQITSGSLPISRGGTGASTKTAAFDALSPNTTKGDLIVSDGTNNIRLPRGSDGQVLTTDSAQTAGVKWSNASTGTVTSVTGGMGLNGGTITSAGTLSVNVGTGANQIVQLDGVSRLPAVDGSLLTSLNTSQISAGTLPISRGGTNNASLDVSSGKIVYTDGAKLMTTGIGLVGQAMISAGSSAPAFGTLGVAGGGTGIVSYSIGDLTYASGSSSLSRLSIAGIGSLLTSNGSAPAWSSPTSAGLFINGGNAFTSSASIGTTTSYDLTIKTNNMDRMTFDTSGHALMPSYIGTLGYATASMNIHSTGTDIPLRLQNDSASGYTAIDFHGSDNNTKFSVGYSNPSNNAYININSASSNLEFQVQGTTKMTLLAAGRASVLDVNGSIRTGSWDNIGGTILDWSKGNSAISSFSCSGPYIFKNLLDGGAYTLVVTDTGTNQCNFPTSISNTTTAGSETVSYRFQPANAARTSSSHTIYNFKRVGNVVYVSWSTGW